MHRMHANRVSAGGTSTALDDSAVQRISSGIQNSQSKRTAKHHKTASKILVQEVQEPIQELISTPVTIKIASINEISSDFERIGTGFYRKGHHLWELSSLSEGGFVLVRKKSEDHVLGYDPEPISKSADRSVMDRNGNTIKVGSTVKLPHRGKIANAVVIVLQPNSLGVELDSGEKIDAPPDMCELVQEDNPTPGQAFDPDIEPSSKAGKPENEETDEIEDETENKSATKKVAQNTDTPVSPAAPAKQTTQSVPAPKSPSVELPRRKSVLINKLDSEGFTVMQSARMSSRFVAEKKGDTYKVYAVQERMMPLFEGTADDVMKWEAGVGDLGIMESGELKHAFKAMLKSANLFNMKTWKEYWFDVGQRIAATRKPLTPEQKERRKQRRKERQLEHKGLPPGTKLPPRSKTAVIDGDEIAQLKERNRLFQQLIDELEFILQDESLRTDEVRLADELELAITEHKEQLEEMDNESNMETEDNLSIEIPPEEPGVPEEKVAKRVVVSMSEL